MKRNEFVTKRKGNPLIYDLFLHLSFLICFIIGSQLSIHVQALQTKVVKGHITEIGRNSMSGVNGTTKGLMKQGKYDVAIQRSG